MRFDDAKNDTWRLVPADEMSVSAAALEKQAGEAKHVSRARRAANIRDTPWALLAENELQQPFGWKWKEMYTGVNAPRQVANANNRRGRRATTRPRCCPGPSSAPPPKL